MQYKTKYLNKTDLGGYTACRWSAEHGKPWVLESTTLASLNPWTISVSDGNPEEALDFPRLGFISSSSDLAQSPRVPLVANEQAQLIVCWSQCEADPAFCFQVSERCCLHCPFTWVKRHLPVPYTFVMYIVVMLWRGRADWNPVSGLAWAIRSTWNRFHLVGSSLVVDQVLPKGIRCRIARCSVGGSLICWRYFGLITPQQHHRDHFALKCVQKNESNSCAKQYIKRKNRVLY